MSETPDSEQSEETSVFDQQDGVDWLLAWLIGYADHGVEFPIIATVAGSTVTGTIISGRKYFELVGDRLRAATVDGGDDLRETIASGIAEWAGIYPPKDNPAPMGSASPAYLHLSGARMVDAAGNMLPADPGGVLWRIKLASVDSFTFGKIERE